MEALWDWNYDINDAARRRERIAWIVAGLCLVLAIAAVIGVAALAPLKTVEPIFVRVDATTGAIDVLQRVDEEIAVGRDEAVDRGYLARYVHAREGYFYPTVREQYRRVVEMSVGDARSRYEQSASPDNPSSPVRQYKDRTRVDVVIRSISFLKPGLAQVRYRTVRRNDEGETATRNWIATIAFEYERNAAIPLSSLSYNALGFAVTEYRREQEDG